MGTAPRALVLVALFAAGCSPYNGGGGTSGGGTTTWVGIVQGSDGVESGSLSVTANTANPRIGSPGSGLALATNDLASSGTYKRTSPTAATVALSGTYNPTTNQLDLSGSSYQFTGSYDGDSRLDGSFTGPGGGGNFVTEQSGASIRIFCGTFNGDDSGTWNFLATNGEVHGLAQSSISDTPPTPLDGIVDLQGHVTIFVPGTSIPLASGDITGNVASGQWANLQTGKAGAWRGDTSCE